ncbi:MAG: phosphohydrolase [Ruminococcaceae bacterium]|nr:phosphohydrolase [Oscillospiraceae bacterium]
MTSITTYTKKTFDPLAPRQELIDILDIAHSLSLLCRANGHFPEFYSVGEHCVNCAREANARGYSARIQLACLLHDASEAYLSDVTRPVKSALPEYKKIENALADVIYAKWLGSTLSKEEHALMREVDDTLLYYEMLHYFGEKVYDAAPPLLSKPLFRFDGFEKTEQRYLALFELLCT